MDKFVTSGALKKTIDLTKDNLTEHDTRLQNIENATPTELQCENVITKVPDNVQNILKLTSVQGKTLQNHSPSTKDSSNMQNESNCTIAEDSYFTIEGNGTSRMFCLNMPNTLKTNTQYTLIIDIKENTLAQESDIGYKALIHQLNDNYPDVFKSNNITINNQTGILKYLLTTRDTFDGNTAFMRSYLHSNTTSGKLTLRYMLLEGDWTNKETPAYFEGIQSVQNPLDVQVTGKNLFDGELFKGYFGAGTGTGIITQWNAESEIYRAIVMDMDVGTYTISFDKPVNVIRLQTPNHHNANIDTDMVSAGVNKNNITNLTFKVLEKETVYLSFRDAIADTNWVDGSPIQLERNTTATAYEPYKQPIAYKLPFDGELRSLPNEVADAIVDGKLIRRVGKVMLNGSENWAIHSQSTDEYNIYWLEKTNFTDVIPNIVNPVNSSYFSYEERIMVNRAVTSDYTEINKICMHISGSNTWITYPKAISEITDLSSFKQYLANNPITIYYQFAEPEIINLDLQYNNPIYRAYANGNIIQNNTPIHPILTFEYQTGLQGAINDLQTEVEENQRNITNMLANETGLQTVTERVNDLVMQDGNIKLEEMQGNTVQNHVPIVYDTKNQKTIGTGVTITSDGYISAEADGSIKMIAFNPSNTLKTNTTYTLLVDVAENTLTNSEATAGKVLFCIHETSTTLFIDQFAGGYLSFVYPNQPTGIQKYVITTKESFNGCDTFLKMYMNTGATSGKIKFRMLLLEGDWTGKEIPAYFTGIKSVNEEQTGLQVRSVGKNLFNIDSLVGNTINGVTLSKDDDGFYVLNGTCTGSTNLQTYGNYLKAGIYSMSANNDQHNGLDSLPIVQVYAMNGSSSIACLDNQINSKHEKIAMKTSNDYLFRVRIENGKVYNNYRFKPQLELNDVATEYEPYKESTITIPYAEPLRRLPNGVADEVKDGKVIRRVGKGLINTLIDKNFALENDGIYCRTWQYPTSTATLLGNVPYNDGDGTTVNLISDILLPRQYDGINNAMGSFISLKDAPTSQELQIKLPVSLLDSPDIEGMIKWVQNNPITLYYELATPIEEEIPEITLAGYKHLIFDNDIVPTSATVSFANSNYARLVALEKANVSQSKTIANLCGVVDFITLQIGDIAGILDYINGKDV